jgi:hypothetical protein
MSDASNYGSGSIAEVQTLWIPEKSAGFYVSFRSSLQSTARQYRISNDIAATVGNTGLWLARGVV